MSSLLINSTLHRCICYAVCGAPCAENRSSPVWKTNFLTSKHYMSRIELEMSATTTKDSCYPICHTTAAITNPRPCSAGWHNAVIDTRCDLHGTRCTSHHAARRARRLTYLPRLNYYDHWPSSVTLWLYGPSVDYAWVHEPRRGSGPPGGQALPLASTPAAH